MSRLSPQAKIFLTACGRQACRWRSGGSGGPCCRIISSDARSSFRPSLALLLFAWMGVEAQEFYHRIMMIRVMAFGMDRALQKSQPHTGRQSPAHPIHQPIPGAFGFNTLVSNLWWHGSRLVPLHVEYFTRSVRVVSQVQSGTTGFAIPPATIIAAVSYRRNGSRQRQKWGGALDPDKYDGRDNMYPSG